MQPSIAFTMEVKKDRTLCFWTQFSGGWVPVYRMPTNPGQYLDSWAIHHMSREVQCVTNTKDDKQKEEHPPASVEEILA